jgi:putative glutamine amidotransferase
MPITAARVVPLAEPERTPAVPPPVIGIICCAKQEGEHTIHAVTEKYVVAAIEGAGGVPFLVPAIGGRIAAEAMVAHLDGILIPGARSNVEPHHYGGPPSAPDTPHDPARDCTALPLLRAAVAADLPVLAICRGVQELNVALGGTLHQRVHELPGRLDHRARRERPLPERYAYDAHPVALTEGGYFERLAGSRSLIVNSLHGQGIDRPAPGLAIEAVAPDGQIEAVRLPSARFVVGVQWHPEFSFAQQPFSRALLAAFGEACRAAAKRRTLA